MAHPHHAASVKFYALTALLLLVAVLLSFIAVFVPWAMKDIAVGVRLWAYPFKNCAEYTFSTLNAESCQDNDFSAPDNVSGGNPTCRTFLVTAIIFVFIMVITGVITLIVCGLLLWGLAPKVLGALVQFGLFVVFAAALLAWIMFIVYAETVCAENSPIFPVRGYSYGFILQVIASFIAFLAMVTGYLALMKLLRARPAPVVGDKDYEVMEYPLYPQEYGYYPQTSPGMERPTYPMVAPTPYWSTENTPPAAGWGMH